MSMRMLHTPGPWKIGEDDGSGGCTIENKEVSIAEVYEQKDARLIAQAPAMLEALRELYDAYCTIMASQFDYPDDPWTPEGDYDGVALKVRALLETIEKGKP